MKPLVAYVPVAEGGAAAPAGTPERPWTETRVVGKPLPRVDAWERVSGSAVYTLDLALPEMLHAAVLRCPHAHARVKRVDTSRAERMPGVHAVLTAGAPGADIPWYEGQKGPTSTLFDRHCRYQGEEVAAVAAETVYQAHDALRAVDVEYEELPFVVDPVRARDAGAPAVHEGGNRPGEPRVYTRGDVTKGLAAADAVVEMTFRTACQLHTCMELHGSVAQWEGRRLTVWDTIQGVFGLRAELAEKLKLPLSHVRVISHYMGGGFGSKLDLSKHTVIAALLARATGRPVKLVLSREDEFLCVGNRPPTIVTLKAGARKDGTLTVLEMKALGTGGAYPHFPTSGYLVGDLYLCPNVHVEQENAYTNAGQGRAFRAPGFPPAAWALEQTMDALAEKLGLDAIELRLKNVPTASQLREMAFTSTGLAQCLREGARSFGWKPARPGQGRGRLKRGVGVAAGMWGWEGAPPAAARVTLHPDGSVTLATGVSDLGTGAKTVLAMVAAEELGVSLDAIEVENADTGTTLYAPGAGGSQTVVCNAPAVRTAAAEVRRQLLALAAEELKRPVGELTVQDGAIVAGEAAKPVPMAELKSLAQRQGIEAVGHRGPNPEGKVALPFVAQFAEVEVDTATGEVRVLRMLAAQDSGRVMNALTYENQVFGGITMGLGYALTEGRVLDPQTGRMVNANWHDYRIATSMDGPPDLKCLPIDLHDVECNTTGAKGLGEPATIPTAAAIGNAIYNATGVRVTETPVTPSRLLEALAAQQRKG